MADFDALKAQIAALIPDNTEQAITAKDVRDAFGDTIDAINTAKEDAGAVGATEWGDITGDLEDQTDLKDALDAKQDTIADLSDIRSGAAAGATAYQKPSTGIPASDMASAVQTSLGKADSAYQKPSGGIPKADLDSGVNASLNLADSAVQPAAVADVVKYSSQSLTDAQKGQARTNIGALSSADVASLTSEEYVEVASLPTASASTIGKIYLVGPDGNGEYDRYITSDNGDSTYSWVQIGSTSIDLSDYATKEEVDELGQKLVMVPIEYPVRNKQMSVNAQGIWANSSGICVLIPITPGKTYIFHAISANNIAVLNESAFPSSSRAAVFATGYSSRIAVGADEDFIFTAPNDAQTLWTFIKSGSTGYLLSDMYEVLDIDQYTALEEKVDRKVDAKPGKNLYDKDAATAGISINSAGVVGGNASYTMSDYCPVKEGTYNLSALSGTTVVAATSNGGAILYDAHKHVVGVVSTSVQNIAIPSGVAFIRFSVVNTYTEVQLEEGNARTSYEPYSPVGGYPQAGIGDGDVTTQKIADSAVTTQKIADRAISLAKTDFAGSKNLIDTNDADYAPGKALQENSSGTLNNNASYNTTGFIPVEAGEKYTFSCNGAAHAMRVLLYYNAAKSPIASSDEENVDSPITVPSGAYFIRITWAVTGVNPQFEKGTTATPYEAYKVTILPSALPASAEAQAQHVGAFYGEDDVAASGVIYLDSQHINKNTYLDVAITGAISAVKVGLGYTSNSDNYYRGYAASWLELSATEVKLYRAYNAAPVLSATYQHGLTLTDKTYVSVSTKMGADGVNAIVLKVSTNKGDIFTQALPAWGMGRPFFENAGSGSLHASIGFMARDLDCPVWCFSDSMASYWRPDVDARGFVSYLSNDQPGLSPSSGIGDLQNILQLGKRPDVLVWMLGANGPTSETKVDGQYVINSSQKSYLEQVISICTANDIQLILTALPTWPSRVKKGFDAFVKDTGLRYIDLDGAVESDEYGVWHAAPSLRAWTGTYGTVYTPFRNSESPLATGQPLFDASGDLIADSEITAIEGDDITATIEGSAYAFTKAAASDIVGLLGQDGLHPTEAGGKVYAMAILAGAPELTIV